MSPLTPVNIRARRIALWACSFLGLLAVSALTINADFIGPNAHEIRWQRFHETVGEFVFNHRNPIAIIFLLMFLTGIMHAFKKEFRVSGVTLSLISFVALFLAFNGGIRSDF